jgi:hypothetical protein
MTEPLDHDVEPDPELARLLREWTAPALPDTLDDRVKALFRQRAPRRPLWRRLFATSVRVPLPVAVAVLVALVLVALWRSPDRAPERESAESPAATQVARQQTPSAPAGGGLAGFEPVREIKVKVLAEPAAQ